MSKWRIINGDCREVVPKVPFQFDFIFADPPFNIGENYSGYKDNLSVAEYGAFTAEWIQACWAKCRGVMCLHGPDDLVPLFLMAEVCGNMNRIAWVNWHYRFGQCHRANWIDTRCHCLIYAKYDYTWNPDAVMVPSDRAAIYGDKRTQGTATPGLRLPFNVWGVGVDHDEAAWGAPVGVETARPIPGYPDYYATWEGGILSNKYEEYRYLRQNIQSGGKYLRCNVITSSGKIDHRSVHILVCSAFHGQRPAGKVVRHLDGVSTNNCADNLCWGTTKENAEDRAKHGGSYFRKGQDHPHAKLTQFQVDLIRDLVAEGSMTQTEAADTFEVSPSQIGRIIKETSWVPGQVFGVRGDSKNLGRVQGNSGERRAAHPNQLPEVYLERLIKAYTNPGDRILDPFCGSGTTVTVATALGRDCVTCDVSEANCVSARERVAAGALRVTQ